MLTPKTLETLRKASYVAVPLLCVVLGIGIGWGAKPDQYKIEEKIKVVEVEKQVVVTKEVLRVEYVKIKDAQVADRWHREKTEEKKPDGTVVSKEVEDRNIDSHTTEKQTETQVKVVEVEKKVYIDREVTKEVEIDPVLANWHMSLLAGVAPRLDSPINSLVMVGAQAERRVVGPLFLGAWVMGGSTVQALQAFNVQNVSVGLSLGAEF